MSDIRSRAVTYARQLQLNADVMEGLKKIQDTTVGEPGPDDDRGWAQFRIGIDNMIAAGFEMGYAAAQDDATPRRALVDRMPWSRRARAARAARKAEGDSEPGG